MVNSPRIEPLRLPPLEAGILADLVPRGVIEAVLFENAVFEEVNLTDAVISESRLDGVSISDSVLRGIRVSETEIVSLNAPVFAAPLSRWQSVTIERSRIGSAEMFESDLSMVRIQGCKLGYLNLRSSSLTSVIISDCSIDELDLGGVTAKRVVIADCDLGTLDVTRARLVDVDLRGSNLTKIIGISGLRGATVDVDQLAALAPHLASEAGIIVE